MKQDTYEEFIKVLSLALKILNNKEVANEMRQNGNVYQYHRLTDKICVKFINFFGQKLKVVQYAANVEIKHVIKIHHASWNTNSNGSVFITIDSDGLYEIPGIFEITFSGKGIHRTKKKDKLILKISNEECIQIIKWIKRVTYESIECYGN